MANDNPVFFNDTADHAALRQALAISRLITQRKTFEKSAAKASKDPATRTNMLQSLFLNIHKDAYEDWRFHLGAKNAPGEIQNTEALRHCLIRLGEKENPLAIFDQNGFVIGAESDNPAKATENLSKALAKFYYDLRKLKPFEYGNQLTLDFFMSTFCSIPGIRGNFGKFDLRALDQDDISVLHDPKSSQVQLTAVFQHAFKADRVEHLKNKRDGLPVWTTGAKQIGLYNFLIHTEGNHKFLVTVDGGLVPIEKVKKRLEGQLKQVQLADLDPIQRSDIVRYLPGTENLRYLAAGDKGYVQGKDTLKQHIDGFKISQSTSALYCLDANIMTGLSGARHDDFVSLMGARPLSDLANNEALKTKLLEAAKDKPALHRSIEIAYDHLSLLIPKLDEIKEAKFKNIKPATGRPPKIFMSMGGAGSGKSSAKNAAKNHCGSNYLRASLDDYREDSDLYKVLTKAEHHNDDYKSVTPFADTLRKWVTDHAMKNKYDILYDGSGIEFEPRYKDLLSQCKILGYETEVVGSERALSAAMEVVVERAGTERRTLPWHVVFDKHAFMPSSFMAAAQSPCVDKISLFCLDDHKDKTFSKDYLLAESYILNDEEFGNLQKSQRNGVLNQYFNTLIHGDSEGRKASCLKKMYREKVDDYFKRIPDFTDRNMTYISYHVDKNINRVVAVYDIKRFEKMMEKTKLNRDASSLERADVPSKSLKFLPMGSWQHAVRDVKNTPPHQRH